MKKVVSIFLVVLLLLNVMGYYGVFLGLRYRNSQQFIQRLDAERYSESETITLKIPLTIPYYGDTDFERVDGEIEHGGEFYRLVKQKFERDTLQIVCIKDVKRKHIQKALKEYVKTFADHSADRTSGKSIPSFIKDYVPSSFELGTASGGWNLSLIYPAAEDSFSAADISQSSLPPEI
jgi:hypothetical protein